MKNVKHNGIRSGAALLLVLMTLSGCATDISSNSYSDESVGEVAETESAVVVKIRPVKVGPDQLGKSNTGTIAGGIGGALIGSQLGSGFGGALATVGLAGAGAVGGAAAEKKLKTQAGLEITVKLQSGRLRTLVQGSDVSFVKGERVLLMNYVRGRSKVVKESDQS